MEISFVREAVAAHLKNESVGKENTTRNVSREGRLDSVSGNIRSGLKSSEADPEELLTQSVGAGVDENAISDAHDFNMSRIMELLSDPLLQEDG